MLHCFKFVQYFRCILSRILLGIVLTIILVYIVKENTNGSSCPIYNMTGYKQTLLYIIYIHIPYQITMFY